MVASPRFNQNTGLRIDFSSSVVNPDQPSALIVVLYPGRSGVGRPDIARREVAQTESTPVGVDAVVEADARRALLECGVGALEDLSAIFVDGEGIADGSEFECIAVDASSSVPHDISEIVQGAVPAD